MNFRRFYFNRIKDLSGNSGTGRVAEGCLFTNGRVAVCWQTDTSSTTVYDNIDDVIALHGHAGATEIIWLDDDSDASERPMSWLTKR